MRIDRLLAITVMMLNRDRVTAREMAEKFEVSVRTIYRDLEAIDQAGVPIMSYSGNRGGYGIMDTFRLDRQYLTFEDILSMVSTLRGINSALENRELDAAIEKIINMVPRHKTEDLQMYSRQIVVDLMPMGYTRRQKDRIREVHLAISQQRLLEFEYCNIRGEHTRRCVESMTLVFKGYAWYLFGWCRLKSAYRIFRLSRMKALNRLNESFERRPGTYETLMNSDPDPGLWLNLKLRFDASVRVQVEDYFEPEQIQNEADGSLLVQADVPEDPWIYSFILGYGENVTVLEPVHVQQIIQEKTKNILKLYKPDIQVSQD